MSSTLLIAKQLQWLTGCMPNMPAPRLLTDLWVRTNPPLTFKGSPQGRGSVKDSDGLLLAWCRAWPPPPRPSLKSYGNPHSLRAMLVYALVSSQDVLEHLLQFQRTTGLMLTRVSEFLTRQTPTSNVDMALIARTGLTYGHRNFGPTLILAPTWMETPCVPLPETSMVAHSHS